RRPDAARGHRGARRGGVGRARHPRRDDRHGAAVNGAADLGGMMGFGPVVPEPEDERFHAEWERRILAMVLAMAAAGRWSIDRSRFVRESLPPSVYLGSSYYAIWTLGLERLLVATGLATAEE